MVEIRGLRQPVLPDSDTRETQVGLNPQKGSLRADIRALQMSLEDGVNQERTFPRSAHLHTITASYMVATPMAHGHAHAELCITRFEVFYLNFLYFIIIHVKFHIYTKSF